MTDDAELARKAAGGDQDAAGEIYDRYAPLVRAILLDAAGSLAEANDLGVNAGLAAGQELVVPAGVPYVSYAPPAPKSVKTSKASKVSKTVKPAKSSSKASVSAKVKTRKP